MINMWVGYRGVITQITDKLDLCAGEHNPFMLDSIIIPCIDALWVLLHSDRHDVFMTGIQRAYIGQAITGLTIYASTKQYDRAALISAKLKQSFNLGE